DVILALPNALSGVAVPGAGFLHDALLDAKLDQLTLARDPLTIEDLELRLLERRGHFVLHHLYPGFVADDFVTFFNGANPADVEPHRGVELERVATRGRLRVAEHHADFHPDLVDEDDKSVRALDIGGELAQSLRHQPSL